MESFRAFRIHEEEGKVQARLESTDLDSLSPGDVVRVSRGDRPVRLVRLRPGNFARTVKEKFHLHDA